MSIKTNVDKNLLAQFTYEFMSRTKVTLDIAHGKADIDIFGTVAKIKIVVKKMLALEVNALCLQNPALESAIRLGSPFDVWFSNTIKASDESHEDFFWDQNAKIFKFRKIDTVQYDIRVDGDVPMTRREVLNFLMMMRQRAELHFPKIHWQSVYRVICSS